MRERVVRPRRVIGVVGVGFAAFNGVVGMGIFALPGLVAGLLGNSAIYAYLGCLLIVGLVGLCMAEAGSRVRESGGVYAYIGAAFGPVVGGVAGTIALFAGGVASTAALVRFLLDTVVGVLPSLAGPVASFGLPASVLALVAAINVRGARQGVVATVVISGAKIVPLALLAIVGLGALRSDALALGPPPRPQGLEQAILLLFFAFTGIEAGTYLSGEVRRPARTVPWGLILALSLVALLYVSLHLVAQGTLGASLRHSRQPLVDAAGVLFGSRGAMLLLAATLLSVGGHVVADGLSSPRLLYALAERGQLPQWLACLHPRFRTPARAIAVYALLVFVVAASGTFRQIAVVGTTATLLLYLATCLGLIRLRAGNVAQAGSPFIVPGGPVIPLVASALIAWLLLNALSWSALIATGLLILTIGLFHAVRDRADVPPNDRWGGA